MKTQAGTSQIASESTMEKGQHHFTQNINHEIMKRHSMSTPCNYGSKADCKNGANCWFMHVDVKSRTFQVELNARPVEIEVDYSHQFFNPKTLDERYTMGTPREMQQLAQQFILPRSVNSFPPGAKSTDF
jgi:hypothetical protein